MTWIISRLGQSLGGMVLLLIAMGSAQAAVISIDFTDSDADGTLWEAVGGTTMQSANIGGLGVKLESAGGNLTFNDSAGEAAGCALVGAGAGLVCDGDGIGIGDDEITYDSENEALTVTFEFDVKILSIEFLDLFMAGDGSPDPATEMARWDFDNGSPGTVSGDRTDGGGYRLVEGINRVTGSLEFTAIDPHNSDYALARIKVERLSVPEPASLLLLGFGLIGLGFIRKRR